MFNSPLLDVTIGLVFIFLMYSLLATSINEAIATLFSFRSRMLKNAIITGMLSDTSKDSRWKSIRRGFGSFFAEIFRMFAGFFRKKDKDIIKLGDKFFDHPLIKNYGSSRIFPLPSYIPIKNFSTVLLDVLKGEFDEHLDRIAALKVSKNNAAQKDDVKKDLQNCRDEVKIMELLNYYEGYYLRLDEEYKKHLKIIADDKIKIKINKNNSENDADADEAKKKKHHVWMAIKRRCIWIIEKIKSIWITPKLNNNSDADRLDELNKFYGKLATEDKEKETGLQELFGFFDYSGGKSNLPVIDTETIQILQMHLKGSLYNIEKFVEKIEDWFDDTMKRVGGWYKRQSQAILFIIGLVLAISFNVDVIKIAGRLSTDKVARDKLVQLSIQAVDKYKDDPRVIKTTSVIINGHDTVAEHNEKIFKEYSAKINSIKDELKAGIDSTNEILAVGWGDYGGYKTKCCKINYIISETFKSPKKILGFLILSFAISLGAPFWFDLLNKLVKLRGSGQKENDGGAAASSAPATAQAPVNVTINTKPAGEEAVG
jgi:hypothetical protein